MVLTRYQLANLETGTESYRNKRKSTDHEDVLVADPPIVTISRSHQTQQDNSLDAPLKVDALLEQLDDYECSTLDALMMRWPSLHSRLKGMKPHLPPKKADNKPTLVLDLDETLLHTYRDMDNKYDVDYVLYDHHRTSRLLAGRLRPGVMDFLTWASDAFEIVVWTAGTRDYAMMARTCLDPNNQLIT
ncbi:HAD-like domain-containing protein [Gilbertella persicaria]|nr:HAD-like domain-containing protein [Gilbertella persicaria]KAI8070617.1 HAD-like domain-containing protein [Gilbertella persicaria]